jgi:hypothetical protein
VSMQTDAQRPRAPTVLISRVKLPESPVDSSG